MTTRLHEPAIDEPGREDTFEHASAASTGTREVKTTGWVVVRFIPRPTGIRWLLSSHPIPPLLLLPPIALGLTLSSSFFAFIVITYLARPKYLSTKKVSSKGKRSVRPAASSVAAGTVEEQLLQERHARTFDAQDAQERREGEERQRMWESVESLARGGLRKIPEGRKRQPGTSTLVGGVRRILSDDLVGYGVLTIQSETTAPTSRSTAMTSLTGTSAATSARLPASSSAELRNRRLPGSSNNNANAAGATSDATSPSDGEANEDGLETDDDVRTESTYAPLGDTRVSMGRGREPRPSGRESDEQEESESSEEWEEAR